MTAIDETNCFLYDDNRFTWKGPTKNGAAFTDSQGAASLAAAKTAYDWTADGTDTNSDSIVWAHVRLLQLCYVQEGIRLEICRLT